MKQYFWIATIFCLLFASCRYSRPITARIRDSKSLIKDSFPNKVKITRQYHYLSFRRFAITGFYKQEKIYDMSQSKTYDIVHTRKVLGYTPEIPYYFAIRKKSIVQGKKTLDSRLVKHFAVDTIVCKKIIYENGKRVKVENALKRDTTSRK